MAIENKRNLSLDLIKVVAMIGVVALHCQLFLPRTYHSTYFLSTVVAGFPIPLFFMVSGYLMFGRKPSIKYSVKKIAKILKFLIEFVLLYWLIFRLPIGDSFLDGVKYIPLAMLQEGPLPIFWYFGAMCILYACLPFLNFLDQRYNKFLLYFTLILFVVENILFLLNCVVGVDQHVLQSLRVWNWLFYFCLGGVLKKKNGLNKISIKFWHILIMAVIFVAFYSAVNHFFPILDNTDQSYGSFVCTAYALSIFIYCIQHNYQGNRVIMELSPLFLPVYSLHLFVYEYYFEYVNLGLLGEVEPFVDFAIVAVLTMAVSWVIMKTPVVNRIFKI